ncbi:MAG TPA: hypothetical protein VGR02_09525 [Thermoanaerobaculia bacterium]|jgi:hypothetical protein|nr:hypothetical protein [Thermoanaerobaculia bacterium]
MKIALALLLTATSLVAQPADPKAYGRCTSAAMQPKGDLQAAIAACAGPARQGIPGAQYAMGALLLNSARGDEVPAEAIAWLEKAAGNGHLGAAYTLAVALSRKHDPALAPRIRELMTAAACGQYRPAIEEINRAGMAPDQLRCAPRADADFTGEWSGALQWTKVSPGAGNGPELKVIINGGRAAVFIKRDGSWREVKPGKFLLTQVEQTAVLSAVDSGSDFDGVWIEAWTIHLLRLSADEAQLSYLRTVNNRDMPASLEWRTFTTIAEGHVRRTPKP